MSKDVTPGFRRPVRPRSRLGPAGLVLLAGCVLGAVPQAYAQQPQNGERFYRDRVDQRLIELEDQMRSMTGEVERLRFQMDRLTDRVERLVEDVDFRFRRLEDAAGGAQALTGDGGADAVGNEEGRPASEPAPPRADGTTRIGAAPPGGAADGTLPSGNAAETYARAYQLVIQTRYDEAERGFREFLERYPDHRLTENAKYWLGETYYVRGRYKEAASTFMEGWKAAPQGSKAPSNLLKLGLSLAALGKTDEACVTYDKLLTDNRSGDPSVLDRARAERKSLGCS